MKEVKYMLGVMLGEIYELKNQIAQTNNEEPPYEEFTIEALKNGYEHVVDREFRIDTGFTLTTETYERIGEALNDYEVNNPAAVETLDGFYRLPLRVQQVASQEEWFLALRAMIDEGRFSNIIPKLTRGETPDAFRNLLQ